MSKAYPETKDESTIAAEPVVVYAAQSTSHVLTKATTSKEDILSKYNIS